MDVTWKNLEDITSYSYIGQLYLSVGYLWISKIVSILKKQALIQPYLNGTISAEKKQQIFGEAIAV